MRPTGHHSISGTSVYYINLDHRTDRRTRIEKQLEGLPWPVERIQALHTPGRGIVGCGSSHIRALERFIESGHESCIIFEDDFAFVRPKNDLVIPTTFEWDVIMLAGCVTRVEPFNDEFDRCVDVGTLSGYMVHRNFAHKLLENYKEGLEKLKQEFYPPKYAIDIYMKSLQKESNWFIYKNVMGAQYPDFSDIEGRHVSWYKNLF